MLTPSSLVKDICKIVMDSGQFDDAEDDNGMSFLRCASGSSTEELQECSQQQPDNANIAISPIRDNTSFDGAMPSSNVGADRVEPEHPSILRFQTPDVCATELKATFTSAPAPATGHLSNAPAGFQPYQLQTSAFPSSHGQILPPFQATPHESLASSMAIAGTLPQGIVGAPQQSTILLGPQIQQKSLVGKVHGLSSSGQTVFLRAITGASTNAAVTSTGIPARHISGRNPQHGHQTPQLTNVTDPGVRTPDPTATAASATGASSALPHGVSLSYQVPAQVGVENAPIAQSQTHLAGQSIRTAGMHGSSQQSPQQLSHSTIKGGSPVFGKFAPTSGQQTPNRPQASASAGMKDTPTRNEGSKEIVAASSCTKADPASLPVKPSRKRDSYRGGSPPKRKKNRRSKVTNVFKTWAMARHQEEGPVACATRFVVDELQHGMWPSPSFQGDAPQTCKDDPKVAEIQHKAHMKVVAASLEHFSRHVILPAFEKSVASFNIPASSRYFTGDSAGTELCETFYATLLALREIMTQNAERIFGSESFCVAVDDAGGPNSAKHTTRPGYARLRRQGCMEDKLYCTSLLATGVVLAAIKRYVPTNSQDVAQKFLDIVRSYDGGDDEFALCLKDDDGRSCGVMPNGIRLNREENIALNVSLNWAQERHPLSRRRHERLMGVKRPRELVSVPETNACVIAVVENLHDSAYRPPGHGKT